MKKIITLVFALVAFASCSKETPFEELDLLRIQTNSDFVLLYLDGSMHPLRDTTIRKSDYSHIEFDCHRECKVSVNGALYYGNTKIK